MCFSNMVDTYFSRSSSWFSFLFDIKRGDERTSPDRTLAIWYIWKCFGYLIRYAYPPMASNLKKICSCNSALACSALSRLCSATLCSFSTKQGTRITLLAARQNIIACPLRSATELQSGEILNRSLVSKRDKRCGCKTTIHVHSPPAPPPHLIWQFCLN